MTHPSRYSRIAFVASTGAEAQAALAQLIEAYGNVEPAEADVIVALGGDGLMLQTLHRHMRTGKPIYGMHRGTVGFLMNEYNGRRSAHAPRRGARHRDPSAADARDRYAAARCTKYHAINEVSLFRAEPPGGAAAHPDRRPGAHARAGRRRHHGGDAGGLDRL